ncbi:M66 family metalloprotease [Yersinia sp. 2540 StPb PI]|uniref:M66 family metalloprotease n=1 Tax=Yersinia sp. 2540 StPb PI TaxID=3117406 RepID=UPI003FA461D4
MDDILDDSFQINYFKDTIMHTNDLLIFNTNSTSNDLQGTLQASIQFVQSQIIPVTPKLGDPQPYLTGNRKALMMVKPNIILDNLLATISDKNKQVIGSLQLNPPGELPDTVYHFEPLPGNTYVINTSSQLASLADPDGNYLKSLLSTYSIVDIRTADGLFVDHIYLPNTTEQRKMVRMTSRATYSSTIHYSGQEFIITQGNTVQFQFFNGRWYRSGEVTNQWLIYSQNTWSIDLPAEWIKPGMTMAFTSGSLVGQLNNIRVGAPTELILNTIDIGMLTTPRNSFRFAKQPDTHREYFQTVPVSRMIVNNYQSIHLQEVMLPTGNLLINYDPSIGDWHNGTMRQSIGKELISLGINHASYGLNSTAGEGEDSPFTVAQLSAHNSIGRYSNGVVVHGGSGGGSIVTLDNSLGNEFSHEIGHNYGLGHYPNGFNGSVHRGASEINSTWGWDMDLHKFIPNFKLDVTNQPSCYENTCELPFYGHSFGFDPMAGGEPMTSLNNFTLHTPYTATLVQQFLESKAIFSSDSPTGFSKWDEKQKSMVPYFNRVDIDSPTTVPISDLSANGIAVLLNKYRVIKIAMQDGHWTKAIDVPEASQNNKQCIILIDHRAGYNSELYINGQIITVTKGFRMGYLSDGQRWNETILLDSTLTRITASNQDLSAPALKILLTTYKVLNIAMQDGNWASEVHIPPASQDNNQSILIIDQSATYNTTLYINGLIITLAKGTHKYYVSDGKSWRDIVQATDLSIERVPQLKGVAVTTLIGYYDPEGVLTSYIFPALHGAYGFIYSDNTNILTSSDMQLWVESATGTLRFKLHNNRLATKVMNKFHINIPASTQNRTVSIVRNGVKLVSRTITPATETLTYTINGE